MSEKGNLRTYLKVLINLGIMLALILCCIFVVPKVIVYFMPFVVGWIISLIASPLVKFLEKTFKIKRKVGSAVTIIAVIAAVVLLAYLIGAKLVQETVQFIDEVPQMWKGLQQDFDEIGQKLEIASRLLPASISGAVKNITENIGGYLGNFVGNMSTPTWEALSRFAENLPSIFIGVIMCLLSSYLFVADKEYVPNLLKKVLPNSIVERWSLIKKGFHRAVGGYFKAQFKIEVWMYVLLTIGFSILKVRYAAIISIGVAFLDLLPFFGTGTVLLPWAAIKFLSGDYMMVIGLLIIWGVGQLARQLIQPKIVGDSVGLSPIPTLVLLYVGYKAAGVIGMIIAVPIGIIILNMYEEGVFDTFLDSMKILYASISNFRHLKDEDMEAVRIYKEEEKKRLEAKAKRLEEQHEKQKGSMKHEGDSL